MMNARTALFLAFLAPLAVSGCAGGGLMGELARPGSRTEGSRRVFRGSAEEVRQAIETEWRKVPELSVRRDGETLVATQAGSGFTMTMSARFGPSSPGNTDVELLISLSYTLALELVQDMETKHLAKLAADTGR